MIRPVVNFDEPLVNSSLDINLYHDVKIYPNPFVEYTSICFSNQNYKEITVFDMMGRSVKR